SGHPGSSAVTSSTKALGRVTRWWVSPSGSATSPTVPRSNTPSHRLPRTRVDAAEDHEAEAEAVTAPGVGRVATACAAAGVRCCHVSTDYVFDGTARSPIPEDAPPSPRSAYGRTKWHGEVAVRAQCPDHLIVRTSWLYGRQGPNFVLTMLRLAAERPQLRVVADQHGAPTWTGHLAPAMLRLLEIGPPGTYHLTNSGASTWYAFAAAAIQARGLAAEVVPITT